MIKFKRTLFVMFIALMLMSFTNIYLRMTAETVIVLPKGEIVLVPVEIEKISIEIDQTDTFLDAIGMRESSNRYDVVNGWGYMGKYQFGKRTLKALGYDVSRKEFLNSPYLQEKAMLDLLHHNRKILKTYIDYWDGKTIHGKRITESGILAAAHLAGPGNVKKFFRNGVEFKDGNGTKMTSYLTQFSGYKLNLD
jgi:hypothetical protein